MTCLRFAAILAALLAAAAFVAPAQAASSTSLTSKYVWSTMDRCSKAAHDKYPDETADALIERLTAAPAANEHAAPPWRQLGLGAQILVDLGVRRLRVLGTPRRLVGLAGFGLEVEGHEEL